MVFHKLNLLSTEQKAAEPSFSSGNEKEVAANSGLPQRLLPFSFQDQLQVSFSNDIEEFVFETGIGDSRKKILSLPDLSTSVLFSWCWIQTFADFEIGNRKRLRTFYLCAHVPLWKIQIYIKIIKTRAPSISQKILLPKLLSLKKCCV